jgi:hypothetical protein
VDLSEGPALIQRSGRFVGNLNDNADWLFARQDEHALAKSQHQS